MGKFRRDRSFSMENFNCGRHASVSRLGYFLMLLVNNFSKIAQIFGDFWSILSNITSKAKTDVVTFCVNFCKTYWATFYSNIS